MGGGGPALLQRRVDAPAHAAGAADDGAGAAHGDCLRRTKRGRCGKPRSGFPRGSSSPVRVRAINERELTNDALFHLLTGHYPTATHLLPAGVDIATIALWLGHERLETTHQYVEADLQLKEDALRKLEPLGQRTQRFKADSSLLAFLTSL